MAMAATQHIWDQPEDGSKEGAHLKLKSEQEIALFTVDENLGEMEKMLLFLTGGLALQQRIAIDNLPGIIQSRGCPAFERVQPLMQAALSQLGTEAQVAAAEAFSAIMRGCFMSAADVSNCMLPLILANVQRESPEEEAAAWMRCLVQAATMLDRQTLLAQVVPLALERGQVNESASGRMTACAMLTCVAPHLAGDDVASFLPRVLVLCQDTDSCVREAAAHGLAPLVAALLGSGHSSGNSCVACASGIADVLEELKELLGDEVTEVRIAALGSLLRLLEVLPPEQRRQQALPIARAHMQPLELALPVQRVLAAGFGRLLAAVRTDLCAADAPPFYACFRHLAAHPDVRLRVSCASVLHGLMSLQLPGAGPEYFSDTLADLAADGDESVRVALAGGLGQVATALGPHAAGAVLRKPLLALLRDSPAVCAALLPGLAPCLAGMAGMEERHREPAAAEVSAALLAVASQARGWRVQRAVAEAMEVFPAAFGADAAFEQWMPLALCWLTEGAAAVKPAAAGGVVALFRASRKERQRTEAYCRLVRELARGQSCWQRRAFLAVAEQLLARFSARWIKEYCYDVTLELLADPVPNVRFAAAALLPALKQMLRLPEDVELLEALNGAMTNLMTDIDRDVSNAARSAHEAFKGMPVRVAAPCATAPAAAGAGAAAAAHSPQRGGGSGSGSGMGECSPCDRVKEMEEAEFTMAADEVERLRAELWQSAAERRGTAARRAAAMQDLPLTSRGRLPHTSGSETSSSGGGGGGARSRSSMELIRVTPRASGAACSGASMLVGGGASSRASGGAARASPGGGAAASPSGSGGSGVGAAGLLPAAGARSGVAAAPAPTPAAAAAKAAKGGTAGSLASSTTPAAAAPASKKTSALPPPTQPRPRFL